MAEQTTVAVAGAPGFVGRHVVAELISKGFAVRALAGSTREAREALPRNAGTALRIVQGDPADGAALDALLAGSDACVNCIGIIREEGGGRTFGRTHAGVTRALVNACRKHAVGRFVLISALGVGPDGRAEYQRSKFDAESIVRKSGLDWTILRPSLILGAGSGFLHEAKKWVRGEGPPWVFLPYFTRSIRETSVPLGPVKHEDPAVQPVAVEDVAMAAAQCLRTPQSVGEVYNLAGPEVLTWPALLRALRDHVPGANEGLEPMGIPGDKAAAMARAARFIGLGGLLPFDEGMALMGGEDNTGSAEKARAHLDFRPRALARVLETCARA